MSKYEISFGLQYDAWEMEMKLPDWESYESDAQAEKSSEETMVSALLCADAIFLFYRDSVQKILPAQRELYQFSFLKEKAYDRLGPPLSPDDLDQLIEKGQLESVIFSERYMLTENDYEEFNGTLVEVYNELKKNRPVRYQMPETLEYPEEAGTPGYLFESIWYRVKCME